MTGMQVDGCSEETERYAPLIRMLARRMMLHVDRFLYQDLVQAGHIGLLQAARRFDPQRGVQFATYAVPWILGEMRRALRDALDADRSYLDRRRLKRALDDLSKQLGRDPTVQELSSVLRMDKEMIAFLQEGWTNCLSIDDARFQHLQDGSVRAAAVDEQMEGHDLKEAIGRLEPEAREVIRLRYFAGYTQAETAARIGRSQSAVSKAEQRALCRLRALMTAGE